MGQLWSLPSVCRTAQGQICQGLHRASGSSLWCRVRCSGNREKTRSGPKKPLTRGALPGRFWPRYEHEYGPLAQLVEQRPFKAWVAGSNPARLRNRSWALSLQRAWPCTGLLRLVVRTPGFHPGNAGSIPAGDALRPLHPREGFFILPPCLFFLFGLFLAPLGPARAGFVCPALDIVVQF